MAAKIIGVDKGSVARKAGLRVRDELLSINGREIHDRLEYMYLTAAKELELLVRRGKKQKVFRIEKEDGEPLGLDFEQYLMTEEKHCKNKCIFCFIDQLPGGMRDTLYFKDDDTRLSFLQGNYVTLTNMTDAELDRLIELRVSPINLSVHATDPELRTFMMKNPAAGKLYDTMKRFAEAGITMNCQIVLCPDVNDGAALDQTMHDLAALYPMVHSVSIVPVGLTCHREGLCELSPFTAERSKQVVAQVLSMSDAMRERYGCALFYLADEFFLSAGLSIPDAAYYDEYPQLENGVGLCRSLEDEFIEALEQTEGSEKKVSVGIVTGEAASPLMQKLVDALRKKWHNLDCKVFTIQNHFFGPQITVAGLVTATDIISQLQPLDLPQKLLIPKTMLRFEGDMFLDSIPLKKVEKTLKRKITAVPVDGYCLLDALIGR